MKTPKAIKLPSGRWRASVQVKGIRYSITKDTKKAAEKAAAMMKLDPETKAAKMTYREAIDEYISRYAKSLSPATIKGYRDIQRCRIQTVMNLPIDMNTDLQTAFNRDADKVSVKTLKNAYSLISAVCKDMGVDLPKVKFPPEEKKERPFLDVDQIKTFCKAIEGDQYEMPYLLCLHSLRRSEMLALKKSQVTDGIIHVSGAVVKSEKGLVFKSTNKTTASVRDIPIFIPRLSQLIEKAPNGVLCPWSVNSMDKHLRTILGQSGLPVGGFHMLRHSFASLCYFTGVSELTGMKLGGWSEFKTMRQIYTHLADSQKKQDVTKLLLVFDEESGIIKE